MIVQAIMAKPYRDDVDALKTRLELLSSQLAEVKATTRVLSELRQTETRLEQEIASLQEAIAGILARRSLPVLEDVRVASPCTASWDDMIGDGRVRFCGQCQKNVFNLSNMTREDAEALLAAAKEELCVRLYQRDDGTVMTADCEVGVKRVRRRRLAAAAIGGGLVAAGAALAWGAEQQATLSHIKPISLGSQVPSVKESQPITVLPPVRPQRELGGRHVMGGMRPMPIGTGKQSIQGEQGFKGFEDEQGIKGEPSIPGEQGFTSKPSIQGEPSITGKQSVKR